MLQYILIPKQILIPLTPLDPQKLGVWRRIIGQHRVMWSWDYIAFGHAPLQFFLLLTVLVSMPHQIPIHCSAAFLHLPINY